jgi:soluble lytic murein transglycosylase-like protein
MRRRLIIILAIAVVAIGAGVFLYLREARSHREVAAAPKPEAPPDLEKLRNAYSAGIDAIHRGDGHDAVKQFSSFSFKKRAVEQYRLYYLANGYQLANDSERARATLAALWSRQPKLIVWLDAGLNLGNLYAAIPDWRHAAEIFSTIADRANDPNVAGQARWSALESRFAQGDVASVLQLSRDVIVNDPRAPQAVDAIAILRSLSSITPGQSLALTGDERLTRALALIRDSDPQNAFEELSALKEDSVSAALRPAVHLNLGIALSRLRRYDEANKSLETLTGGSYRFAIPAIKQLSQNYQALSASINPNVNKVVTVRQKVGVTKVRVGKGKKRKVVTRPKYGKVKKTVPLVDLAKKAKKEEYDRLAVERLKDLLQLPLSDDVRIDVLNQLIGLAEEKNQDEYEQDLVTQLAKVDPSQEAGLQHFWDKAWGRYAAGDLNGARPLLQFIHDTYRNPNVKRMALYWLARVDERSGKQEQAAATYRNLAQAPYDDIYAVESERRGAPRQIATDNPLKSNKPDWRDIAERDMPDELRLAYELTALSDTRAAMLEIRANRSRVNSSFADALLADLFNSMGNAEMMMLSLRRAFPALATVEQDSVPRYFLAMYYPMKYRDEIDKYSKENGLDPFLIMGLIHQESYYDPKARSNVGALGLMQLMPSTGKELAGRLGTSFNLTDAKTNIHLGTAHFKMLVNLFGGNTELAIASYNAGQGRVAQWRRTLPHSMDEFLEAIPFRETRTYVKHVVMLASAYRRMYP